MDDLKLYGKTEKEIESLLHTVRIFSTDIGMSFGIDKCARVGIRRGKIVKREGIKLPNGQLVKSLYNEDQYKYLGILEREDIQHHEVKKNVKQEYTRRLKSILKSKLSGRNKLLAINAFAIPVVRYTAGIVKWTVEELQKMDRETRKLMTIYRGLHPRADVDRIYLPREIGGRGLKAVEDTVREEELALLAYINRDEPLLNIVKNAGILKESPETQKQYHLRKEKERFENYRSKPLHGHFVRTCKEIDIESTYLWLKKGDIKIETEGLLTAAQDQALPTNSLKNIYNKQ